jgi:preprotein translocase subunit YajC
MFGKLFAGVAAAGVLAAVLTTGALAAPAASPTASPAQQQRQAAKDVFSGKVTSISGTQLTVKNAKGTSETFLRTDATVVVKGRKDKAAWSEIETNSHVRVRFEERAGKLYAKRVHIGPARLAGKVTKVSGNAISIQTRDGKDVQITVTSATRYFELTGTKQRQAGSLSAIHAGLRLASTGSYDSSHNFDAGVVAYRSK